MPSAPPPEWWTWAFWDQSPETIRDLALTVAAVVGLPLLIWRTVSAHRLSKAALQQAETASQRHQAQDEADRERRITDSFTKAIEQLGSDKLEVRLGAIYALERIARDSKRDHGPIMETLTAYVRERASWPLRTPVSSAEARQLLDDGARTIKPTADIEATLTVIARRRREHDIEGQRLDLRGTDLRGAYLVGASLEKLFLMDAHLEGASLMQSHLEETIFLQAHLKRAYFTQAHLERAELAAAHLEHAILQEANLEGADLQQAHLEGADLRWARLEGAFLLQARLEGANLEGTHLERADLRQAHLKGANLEGAWLMGADLRWAQGLTQKQLDSTYSDAETELPEGLTVRDRRQPQQGHGRGA
jgi:uncharacterized protein YjbI with pentapeptide repeats